MEMFNPPHPGEIVREECLIPADRMFDSWVFGRPAGIPLISRAAAPPTPRAYQSTFRSPSIKPLGLTVTDAAAGLGVTRKALSDLLNGHSAVSPEMAIRLEKAGWLKADHWLRLQMQRDLWEVRQRAEKIKVNKRFSEPAPA